MRIYATGKRNSLRRTFISEKLHFINNISGPVVISNNLPTRKPHVQNALMSTCTLGVPPANRRQRHLAVLPYAPHTFLRPSRCVHRFAGTCVSFAQAHLRGLLVVDGSLRTSLLFAMSPGTRTNWVAVFPKVN